MASSPAPASGPQGSRVAPLYHRLYVELRQRLAEGGGLDAATALPSEPALAARYRVSRVTVRRTLERLEAEGLIRRVRGVGTFPVARPPSDKTDISGVLENLISYEQSTTARNLSWGDVEPAGEVATLLPSGPCLRIVRVRSYRGQPISLTTIHVPAPFAALLDRDAAADEPIIRVLDRQGILAERAEQVITAVPASPLAAEMLGVPEGAPLIAMRRLMLSAVNAPVLHQESLYAPDRFEYRMTLSRMSVGSRARWTPIA